MARIQNPIRSLMVLALVAAAAGLAGCAPTGTFSRVTSTAPMVGGDIAGAGGKMDEIYRTIYTPGDPNWSH